MKFKMHHEIGQWLWPNHWTLRHNWGTNRSVLIDLRKRPSLQKKSRLPDPAVKGPRKLSFLTASTRNSITIFFSIITMPYFWIFCKLRYWSKCPRKILFPKSQQKKCYELWLLIIVRKTSLSANVLLPSLTEMFLLTFQKNCFS